MENIIGESKRRSFAKMISWRIIATLTTMAAVFIVTGEILIAVSVGVIEVTTKMIFYYGHERAWNKIRWGKTAGDNYVK